MTEDTKSKITVAAQDIVTLANTILPFLKAAIPAVAAAGGPIGAGLAGAAVLIPLIKRIPTGDVISPERQQELLDEVNAINAAAFAAPEWQPSTQATPAK